MRNKITAVMMLCICFCLLPWSACGGDTVTTTTENKWYEYADPTLYDYYGEWEERTVWNIDMYFVRCDKNAIVIGVRDNDNLGFALNDSYYQLEKQDGLCWVSLVKPEYGDVAVRNSEDFSYVIPDEERAYQTTHCYNFYNCTALVPGRYRITKVFSGKLFSCEFELTQTDLIFEDAE